MNNNNKVELCNDGNCIRVRLGEKRHNKHLFSNKFTKRSEAFKNGTSLIQLIAIAFAITMIGIPENQLPYADKLTVTVTGFGIITTIMIALTNMHFKYKDLQTKSLSKIFDLLSREDVRNARRTIHEEYCRMEKNNLKIEFVKSEKIPDLDDKVDLILSSLDQVSVLVLNGLVDKELFFDTYGELLVRDWNTLQTEIEKRQVKNEKTLRHFTILKNEFIARKDIGNTKPYCID